MSGDTLALPAAPRRHRRPVWWTALGLLLVTLAAAAVLLALALQSMPVPPISITIDGEQVLRGLDPAQLPPAHQVVLVGIVLCTLLALLVIVPVALILSLGTLLMLMLLLVGLPLLVVGTLATLLLSPLLLVGWLVWKLATG
jgi:hypothetical protein